MTTKDIIQHLEETQREAAENKAVEEIPQSELDQIVGAGRIGGSFHKTWSKAF